MPQHVQALDRKRVRKKQKANRDKVKKAAGRKVQHAIKAGVIQKAMACEWCGNDKKRTEGHHFDYSKPLEVVWLCAQCHSRWHCGKRYPIARYDPRPIWPRALTRCGD